MRVTERWPDLQGIAYGGDYNPEQWPREVWDEDVALMREAGVNLVSVGIFSWAHLEPREGEFAFGWLDDVIDLLHANGIFVDLGTPTASPPAWFFATYPESRVVNRDGVTMGFGSRGMVSHSSAAYQDATVRIARELAKRYANHPAVVMWHIHNEYGVPVGEDFSPAAVAAFREWLQERYGDIDALNRAWGTSFWGQKYYEWEHVGAPAASPSPANPAQKLDFARFTDHQLLECYKRERDAIRAHASQPITTNFMANQTLSTDLFLWGKEVDIVSNDHYLDAADEHGEIGLALAADLTRSVASGAPWILMEHSTSAVNWQPRNVAKRPGEMVRNSLSHFARGADAILFFQWRASRSGSEKFHSAMLPHAGTQSRIWREVVELGRTVAALDAVKGSRVVPSVAIIWDTDSMRAQRLEFRPSEDVTPEERIRAYYERLWRDGVTIDFAHPSHDLTGYDLVVAPASYLLTTADGQNLTDYVSQGGTLVVSYFSGIVDENDAVHAGGYGAPLKEALGLTVEEFLPLRQGQYASVAWTRGAEQTLPTSVWQEDLALTTADVAATYVDGPAAGKPAVTRNTLGKGSAWYVSTHLAIEDLAVVMNAAYEDAGVAARQHPEGVEVVTRNSETHEFVVAINHNDHPETISTNGVNVINETEVNGDLVIPGGGVAVVHTKGHREGGGH